MKKISILLVITLLMTPIFSIATYAESKTVDKLLDDKGVLPEMIESMPESMKIDIANNAGELLSWSKVESPKITAIPTEDFDLYINVYDAPDSSTGKERKLIYIYYQWYGHGVPFFRYEDPFGVSWDDDWKPVADSHYHVDEIRYEDGTYKSYPDDTLEYAATTGVGWDADLKAWAVPFGKYEEKVGGYGKIMIEEKEAGKAVSNSVYGAYAHDAGANSSVSLTIKALSISINGKAEKRAVIVDF